MVMHYAIVQPLYIICKYTTTRVISGTGDGRVDTRVDSHMNSIIRFFTILLSIFFVAPALGDDNTVSSKPIVLMLIVESEALAPLQETLKNELAIELVTHTILTKSMRRFSSDGLSATIENIRQIAVTSGAEVVIWLERTDENRVTLNLLAASPDRSMLRSVGAALSVDTGGELAIAARKLLEETQIDLKETPPTREEQDSPSLSPSENDHSRGRRTQLSLGLVTTGGFGGTARSPILLGGAISIGLLWKSGLYADVSLDGFTTPSSSLPNGTVRTVGVRPGVGVGFLWGNGLVTSGPYLGLQAPWQTARAAVGDNRQSKDGWWNFRAIPSVDLRIRLHRNILFSMTPGLGILVHQEVFERVSDGVDIYKSPYLEWHIRGAIIITLTPKKVEAFSNAGRIFYSRGG
jgi:hypothetical protein